MDFSETNDLFAFEFASDGTPQALTISRKWYRQISPEEFGQAVVAAYNAQRLAGGTNTPEFTEGPDHPVHYPQEFKDQVQDFSRQVTDLVAQFRQWEPKPIGEPEQGADRYRNVTVEVSNRAPVHIEVNETWLRSADLTEVEESIIGAITDAMSAEETDPLQDKLAQMRAQYASLVQQRNDYNERS